MISRKWRIGYGIYTTVLLALMLWQFAGFAHCQTPTMTPTPNIHPGYWQVQPGVFVPCNGIKPWLPFTNVGPDGLLYYLGGDVNANIPHPSLYGTYIDAIYFNHSKAYYDARGYIIPIRCQQAPGELCPPNSYPAPADVSLLCTQWAALGNTSQCPGGSAAWYTNAFMGNSEQVWQLSYNFYKPSIDIACSGGPPPPTSTPPPATSTPHPTLTPTASITPAPGTPTVTPPKPQYVCVTVTP